MKLFGAAGVSRVLAIVMLLGFGARYAAAADEGWLVSLEKAKEQAAKEGKDILMEFTGSDWCPPCKALHSKVLTTEVFKTEVPKQFILLKLDNPRDKSNQSEEEQAQYQELSSKMQVSGVPTVMLADASGRPYAKKVGYGGQPAEDYVAQLAEAAKTREKRDELMAKAESAEGVEKAKLLAEALDTVGELALIAYTDVIGQVVELDAKNEAGLKEKYQGELVKAKLQGALKDIQANFGSAGPEASLAKIDQLLTELNPQGEALQEVLYLKAMIQFRQDKDASKATLEAAQKLAPESRIGKQIERILSQVFKPADDEGSEE